ncbi:hypothetical protein AOL_s00210g264 [Orbilia oligospora ATCC 24927]|uniref:Uncharacterized protein n=1 Tax=Arthrobotrys oligospora (strain ATCC 24927 / CBS 115.81 / DSM 1491) TaxID=756982 RepID=G1XSA6_ARTOA|nr:hypothetical protein AOL_s00210g264 [Orbilia oligospora ATCC 24927]EGX43948.1 hypothetical protein AOL_s00210g264 [Orbilia oligospora ATCC 24927]
MISRIHLLLLLLLIYSGYTTASWLLNFPVGWNEESTASQPSHIHSITALYECTVFNSNRWSLPLEATTIYNTPGTFTTNAIAYYRNTKCKDDGLDYIILLNPENSQGVNIIDLKLDGLTVGGTPTSFQAVEFMHYAQVINYWTGELPVGGSVFVFGARGAIKAWSSERGVVKNVDLGRYTTSKGVEGIEKDLKEMALVLGMVTEKVLSEDTGRAEKLKGFVQKKLGGQTAGSNLPEMVEKVRRYEEGLKGNGYAGMHMGQGYNSNFGVGGGMNRGFQGQVNTGMGGGTMGPPNMQPNRGFSTPQELANRPIDFYKLASECLKADKNRLLWIQWYWAESRLQARTFKAALDILGRFERGGVEAVSKFIEEERVVQQRREAIENLIRMSMQSQRNMAGQRQQTGNMNANPGGNMGQGNSNPGGNSEAQPAEILNPQEQAQVPVQDPQNPPGGSAQQPNMEQDDEVIILDSRPSNFQTPHSLPEFSRQSLPFDKNFFANQLPSFNTLAGKSGLTSFNQLSPGPLAMNKKQANDFVTTNLNLPMESPADSIAEMLRRSGWTGGDTPSMTSEFLDPVFQAESQDSPVIEDIGSRKETPKKKFNSWA